MKKEAELTKKVEDKTVESKLAAEDKEFGDKILDKAKKQAKDI